MKNGCYDDYRYGRICPLSLRRLHEFIFFSPTVRILKQELRVAISNDFVAYLVKIGGTIDDVISVGQMFKEGENFEQKVLGFSIRRGFIESEKSLLM